MEEEGPQPWMTSRICVKGLPKQCSDQQLREHFSEKGDITDAKIVRTADGQSRQFGFVGFRSVAEAQAAVKYFNRSFMGAQRLTVEFAEKYGGSHLPRAWSKYTEGTSRYKQLHPGEESQEKPKGIRELKKLKKQQRMGGAAPEEEDPKLAEFLQLMQPRRAGAIWSNEDATLATTAAAKQKHSAAAKLGSTAAQKTAAEEAADGNAAVGGKLSARKTGRVVSGREKSEHEEDASSSSEEDEEDAAPAEKDAVVVDAGVSDMDYLRARMTRNFDESASEQDAEEEDGDDAAEERAQQEGAEASEDSDGDEVDLDRVRSHSKAGTSTAPAPHDIGAGGNAAEEIRAQTQEASIEETARLFVRNLPYSATEAELAEAFGHHGPLSEVHIVLDKTTRKSKGIALIQFEEAAGALAAQQALDGAIFQGRLLHVLPAHRPPPQRSAARPEEGEDAAGKAGAGGFKAAREAERREGAGNRAAWNTLFMRPDTVGAAVAEHYGVSRAELLDREASDLPVRMALGETHVIALTKRSLGEAGVDVTALEAAAAAGGRAAAKTSVARSPDTLLVKNLPYTASEPELEETFGKFGAISRLVLPRTRTLALVQFGEAADARRAFKALAYKRFQSVPLFLEWAPAGIFNADAPLQQTRTQVQTTGAKKAEKAGAGEPVEVAELPTGEEDAAESTTIYVKNLAFATTDATLRAHFDSVVSAAGGSMRAASVAKRKGPDGKPLSAGFGFVECSSEDVAKIALRKLQGSVLDGHKLALQLSLRKMGAKAAPKEAAAAAAAEGSNKAKGTKLVVRNVAFEATRKDVAALFAPFGQIKSCRLPKKFDGTHRGFAFVDFLTKQEARSAAEAVAGTHLYGRRLVVEWAEGDEAGLDELRAKTAARFRPEDDSAVADAPLPKKQRKSLEFV